MNITECEWKLTKNLNVPANVQKRNFFQKVLKRSQKINVNVQNSNLKREKILFTNINFDVSVFPAPDSPDIKMHSSLFSLNIFRYELSAIAYLLFH